MIQRSQCFLWLLLFLSLSLLTHNLIWAQKKSQKKTVSKRHVNFPSLQLYDLDWKSIKKKVKHKDSKPQNMYNCSYGLCKKFSWNIVLYILLPLFSYSAFYKDYFKINTTALTDKKWWITLSNVNLAIGDTISAAITNAWIKFKNFLAPAKEQLIRRANIKISPGRRTTLIKHTGSTAIASKEIAVISSNYITLLILFIVALSLGAFFYWKKRVFIDQLREKGVTHRMAKRRKRKRH